MCGGAGVKPEQVARLAAKHFACGASAQKEAAGQPPCVEIQVRKETTPSRHRQTERRDVGFSSSKAESAECLCELNFFPSGGRPGPTPCLSANAL